MKLWIASLLALLVVALNTIGAMGVSRQDDNSIIQEILKLEARANSSFGGLGRGDNTHYYLQELYPKAPVDFVLTRITHSSYGRDYRGSAIRSLHGRATPAVCRHLLRWVEQSGAHSYDAGTALSVVAESKSPEILVLARECLERAKTPKKILKFCRLLGKLGDRESLGEIIKAYWGLGDKDRRAGIIEALAQVGDKRSIPVIKHFIARKAALKDYPNHGEMKG